MIQPVIGQPGIQAGNTVSYRQIFKQPENVLYIPGGGTIDKAAQDRGNTGSPLTLRAGLSMGRVTSSKKWLPSFLGKLSVAITAQGATTLTLSAADAVELVRRQGASGTFSLIGPPGANGVARAITVTYSAVNTTTGVVTVTAISANQVEQINFNIASTAGNLQLTVQKPDGTFVTTGNAAWNATDATYLANINTALDTATGVVGGIVASAIPAVDPDLGIRLTYSGTGYAGLPWTRAQVNLFPTSSTAAVYSPVTAPVDGRFVVGGLLGAGDGSENPKSVIPDGSGIQMVAANAADVDFPQIARQAMLATASFIDWPSDTGLQAWLYASFNPAGRPGFDFDNLTNPA